VNARYGRSVRAHLVVRPGELGGPRVLVDAGGHARTGYEAEGDALVLVRPDGYVGLRARPGTFAQLDDYLRPLATRARSFTGG
jgi:hypothetical protein